MRHLSEESERRAEERAKQLEERLDREEEKNSKRERAKDQHHWEVMASHKEVKDGLKTVTKNLHSVAQSVRKVDSRVEANTESIAILAHNQEVEYHERAYQSAVLLQVIHEVANSVVRQINTINQQTNIAAEVPEVSFEKMQKRAIELEVLVRKQDTSSQTGQPQLLLELPERPRPGTRIENNAIWNRLPQGRRSPVTIEEGIDEENTSKTERSDRSKQLLTPDPTTVPQETSPKATREPSNNPPTPTSQLRAKAASRETSSQSHATETPRKRMNHQSMPKDKPLATIPTYNTYDVLKNMDIHPPGPGDGSNP